LTAVPSTPAEALLRALGDPVARGLMVALAQEEADAHRLVVRTGFSQSSVYRKLRELQDDGIVRVARFAFTSDGKKVEVYRSAWREVHISLSEGALRVEARPAGDSADRLGSLWRKVRDGHR